MDSRPRRTGCAVRTASSIPQPSPAKRACSERAWLRFQPLRLRGKRGGERGIGVQLGEFLLRYRGKAVSLRDVEVVGRSPWRRAQAKIYEESVWDDEDDGADGDGNGDAFSPRRAIDGHTQTHWSGSD